MEGPELFPHLRVSGADASASSPSAQCASGVSVPCGLPSSRPEHTGEVLVTEHHAGWLLARVWDTALPSQAPHAPQGRGTSGFCFHSSLLYLHAGQHPALPPSPRDLPTRRAGVSRTGNAIAKCHRLPSPPRAKPEAVSLWAQGLQVTNGAREALPLRCPHPELPTERGVTSRGACSSVTQPHWSADLRVLACPQHELGTREQSRASLWPPSAALKWTQHRGRSKAAPWQRGPSRGGEVGSHAFLFPALSECRRHLILSRQDQCDQAAKVRDNMHKTAYSSSVPPAAEARTKQTAASWKLNFCCPDVRDVIPQLHKPSPAEHTKHAAYTG